MENSSDMPTTWGIWTSYKSEKFQTEDTRKTAQGQEKAEAYVGQA